MAAQPVVKLSWRSAGHEATSRCEAIDQLDADSASKQEFEQELNRLVPQPGSSSESFQLRRLREIHQKAQKAQGRDEASTSTSSISIGADGSNRQPDRRRQCVTRRKGKDGMVIGTELYWSAKKLVWSRGGVVVRTFSYEEEVKCACWTWMDSEPTWEISSVDGKGVSKGQVPRTKGKARATAEEVGPVSDLQQSFRQIDIKKEKLPAKRRFRALCVFMPSCLVIYHPHSGQEYIKRLDLEVLNVFPLTIGLLIQRRTEAEDRKKSLQALQGVSGADPPLSTLFYLRRPYDELKAIECVDGIRFTRKKSGQWSAKLKEGLKGRTFNEIDEQVIMVSDSPPILVSASLQRGCLRVYAYAHDRLPFAGYEDNRDERVEVPPAKRAKESDSSPTAPPLARRSTMEGRFGARPKLPSRRSARLESGSSRPSLGGPRSSLGGDRTRTASGAGHVRRPSGGFTSMIVQNGLLLDEAENKSTDEDNMQEMLQLLDEFDEVGEESQMQLPLQTPSSRITAPGTVNRRRTSRTVNVPPRTPYVKSRATEERRTSRTRMSMPGGCIIESNPVSVAMELSQKDEASRLAMTTTSGDKAMARGGLSSEGIDGAERLKAERLSFTQELGQGFSALTLLEELPIAELQSVRDLSSIKAFIQDDRGTTLLYIIIPSRSTLLIRQLIEQPVTDVLGSFTLRSQAPTSSTIDTQIQAGDAYILQGDRTRDLLLAEPGEGDSLHLFAGPPGSLSETMQINVSAPPNGLRHLDPPLRINSQHGLLQLGIRSDPSCSLTAKVIFLCETILSPERFRSMRMEWIQQRPKNEAEEWAVLADLILWGEPRNLSKIAKESYYQGKFAQILGNLDKKQHLEVQSKQSESDRASPWSEVELAKMVEGLNMIAQDVRIGTCEQRRYLPRLASLIIALAHRLGWSTWLDYWLRLVPVAITSALDAKATSSVPEIAIFDIVDHTSKAARGHLQQVSPSVLLVLPRLQATLGVCACFGSEAGSFETMSGLPPTPAAVKAKSIVEGMLKYKIGTAELDRMPISIALPLRQAMKQCAIETPTRWSAQAYLFIDREDLAKQMTPSATTSSYESDTLTDPTGHASNRLFPNDYRLKEVKEMLQTSRPIATKGPDATTTEDQEVIAEQQKRVFVSASDRIKSLSIGRGMFSMSSVSFKGTEQWKTTPLCLRVRILNNCIIQHREPDSDSPELEWPEFHNGVASALQLAISQEKIESSWLYSQLNKEFTPRHAGLIFGIGLLGQLRTLGKIHAHYYLSSRHSATTIGLLLGISLSFLGSCDPLAKALMSIHLIHTLPIHSRPLKTSMLEQSAALVGLGFVFMASRDRWASRMAFKAIATENVMTDDSQMLKRECFSLSAAISLGLICLGQGRTSSLAGEIEKEIIPGLERLVIVFDTHDGGEERRQERLVDAKKYTDFEWKPEISLSTTPASIALALMYLKSNRTDKAEKMPLPQNSAQLETIRPDVLLIRAVCRSLILWDGIRPESKWLDNALPLFLHYENAGKVSQASESCQMAYWSLRVGFIFAIGLKYAGSNDVQARRCLLDELHHFQSQVELRPASYYDKIRQQMLQHSIDIILTSLSIVLAGTGDVEVLQHLRRGLYRVDTLRYGNYMATSMAIGMLFLGAGRFTLSTSDSAIAALLIAFYPRYPINAQDNRCHLQAYRHLWLLAVEARLLSVEDVDSEESSRMPVEMHLKRDAAAAGEVEIISMPCLLPKLQEVRSIRIASDRYFASRLDLHGNPHHQRAIIENRKLYVKKKAADLSHDDDKWGKGSVRARVGDVGACTQLPLVSDDNHQDRAQECERLRGLIKENVHDKDVHALIDVVSGSKGSASVNRTEREEALELFMLQATLDCLLKDKMEILPMMISIHSSTQTILITSDGESSSTESQIDTIFFLRELHQLLVLIGDSSLATTTLLDPTFIRALWTLLQDHYIIQLKQGEVLRTSLRDYASALPAQDGRSRHWLVCLLTVADVPPLSLLLEVKKLVKQHGAAKPSPAMEALVQSVLLDLGYQTRSEVIQLLIETWLS